MPLSSTRLLSVGLTGQPSGGQPDKPTFKSSDSLLFGSKHTAGSTVGKPSSSHAQFSTAAGRLQHASNVSGSMGSSTSSGKWGTWGSSALQPNTGLSPVGKSSLAATSSGRKSSSNGLLTKAKLTTTQFDSISTSTSTSSSAGAGIRSVSVPRSGYAVFDAARGPAQRPGNRLASQVPSTTSTSSHGVQARSSSTGRSSRTAGARSASTAGIKSSSSSASFGFSPYHQARTAEASSSMAAVPGRARVLADRVLCPSSSSDASMHPASVPGGLIGSSSGLRRSGSLTGTGATQQQQQPLLFEDLLAPSSSRRLRAADTAVTHNHAVGSHAPGTSSSAGKVGSSLHHHIQPPTGANSSFLYRLGLQRAATADAVTCRPAGIAPADGSSAAVAGRRVSSASAATTSDKQTALEKLRGTRMRPRASAYGDVSFTPSGRVDSGAVAAVEDVLKPMRMGQPGTAGSSVGTSAGAALRHTSSSGSGNSRQHEASKQGQKQQLEQQRVQRQDSRAADSARDIITALLKRNSSRRLEEAAAAAQQQLEQQHNTQEHSAHAPMQQPRLPSAHLQDAQHGHHHAPEQQQQQHLGQGQGAIICGPVPMRRVTDGGHSGRGYGGPGERLEFPMLQPQQAAAAPRSMSGSYLDIMRSNSFTNRLNQQQQQQQVLQNRPEQDLLQQRVQQPLQELTSRQQYHPQLYQQQVYQPEQYQPLQQQQQRQRLQQQQQQQSSSTHALPPTAAAAVQWHGVHAPSSTTAPLAHLHGPAGVQAGTTAGSSSSSGGGSLADLTGSTAQMYRPPYVPPQAATSAATRDQSSAELKQYAAASSSSLLRQPSSSMGLAAGSSQPAAVTAVERQYSSGNGYVQQQGPLQYHQQQQRSQQEQLILSTDRLSAHDQGPDMTSPQQGFLISTQPMAEHSYDTDTAAAAVAGGGDVDVVGSGADQAAAARRAFLTCSTSSSSECSEDHNQDTGAVSAAGAAASRRGVLGTAACTVSHGNSSRQRTAGMPQQERGVVSMGSSRLDVQVVGRALGRADSSSYSTRDPQVVSAAAAAAAARAGAASDSDSNLSEMTCSSLDSGSNSSSSVDIAVAVRKRHAQDTTPPAVHQYPHLGRSSAAQQQALHGGDASSNSSSPGYASRSALAGTAAGVALGAAASATSSPVPVKAYARSLSNRVGGLPRGCCGIRNQGNTCYQNSALQLLGCVPELVGALLGQQAVHLFQEAAADSANNRSRRSVQATLAAAAAAAQAGINWRPDASVGPALQALVCEMWGFQQTQQRQQRGSPSQMVQRSLQHQQQLQRVTQCMSVLREAMAETDPRWDDGDQWDCQEFCLALLQTVHIDSNRVRGKPKYRELKLEGCEAQQAAEAAAYARSWEDSVVLDIFSWQLQSTMTCASCGKRSHAFDSAQELLVAIPPDSEDVTVQECLTRTTFSPEKMVGEEGYKCESCKALREATKQLQLFTYPQVLLLGLKRFETRGGSKGGNRVTETYSSRKVSTRVRLNAGELLDLSPFCNPAGLKAAAAAGRPPPRYELIAVADHTGYINGGHYTARGRSVLDGSWVEFNDSLVLATDAPSGSTREAYMMLYRLVS